jgi:hypothetical protein
MKPNAIFAAAVLSIVGILIVPLPPPVLDALLALNIFGSALVLLISLRVEDPLEFSSFPPALLLATLFRLALDVSATRLILTQGHLPDGVGAIVPAFGAFVVRGNIVVGLIVFAILITIQFIVIASGAQRGYYVTGLKRPISPHFGARKLGDAHCSSYPSSPASICLRRPLLWIGMLVKKCSLGPLLVLLGIISSTGPALAACYSGILVDRHYPSGVMDVQSQQNGTEHFQATESDFPTILGWHSLERLSICDTPVTGLWSIQNIDRSEKVAATKT